MNLKQKLVLSNVCVNFNEPCLIVYIGSITPQRKKPTIQNISNVNIGQCRKELSSYSEWTLSGDCQNAET
jgi:hypothetical protein